MTLNKSWIRALDFALAAGSLLYGLAVLSWWWVAGGLLGFIMAWLNPAERFRQFLFGRIRCARTAEPTAPGNRSAPPVEPYSRKHP